MDIVTSLYEEICSQFGDHSKIIMSVAFDKGGPPKFVEGATIRSAKIQ